MTIGLDYTTMGHDEHRAYRITYSPSCPICVEMNGTPAEKAALARKQRPTPSSYPKNRRKNGRRKYAYGKQKPGQN